MDSYTFLLALAPTLVAIASIVRDHIRGERERKDRERHRTEDRAEKVRDRRLELFLELLQHTTEMRNAITSCAITWAAPAVVSDELRLKRWESALDKLEAGKRELQRCIDTVTILESERVTKACVAVVALVDQGINLTSPGFSPKFDSAAFDQWTEAIRAAERTLRTVLRDDFKQ